MKTATFHYFRILILILCTLSKAVHGTISWSIPTTISSLDFDVSQPQVVIDVYGNVTAT